MNRDTIKIPIVGEVRDEKVVFYRKKFKYLSLFSGIAGFELGIQQAYENHLKLKHLSKESEQEERPQGRKRASDFGEQSLCSPDRPAPLCIGYSEIDKYAVQIYQKHFPNHTNYGDITKINETELPDFDLLVGGFPCQSFSIAGKRGGFNDTRGTLFFEIARILKHKQPCLLLLENVKGLLSHDQGRTFATIISTLDELGYDLQWQVLNSKNFGVPQNRERVFIIGHLRGTARPKVFPFTADGGQIDELQGHVSNTLTRRYEGAQGTGTYIGEGKLNAQKGELEYVGAIMSENNQKWLDDGKKLSRNFPQGQRVYSKSGISATLASQAGGLGAKTGLYEIGDMKIRRLTPIECERLQGFPDNWTRGGSEGSTISDTQRYKCCGNAVTVNVIQAIIERMI